MKNGPKNDVLESGQVGRPDALSKEISRAVEMMGRVKKSNVIREFNSTKLDQGFSYLLPPPILLCLPSE